MSCDDFPAEANKRERETHLIKMQSIVRRMDTLYGTNLARCRVIFAL